MAPCCLSSRSEKCSALQREREKEKKKHRLSNDFDLHNLFSSPVLFYSTVVSVIMDGVVLL